MNGLIGGNKLIELYKCSESEKNAIGESVDTEELIAKFYGYLDYVSGEVGNTNFNAAINESTHVFISDFVNITDSAEVLKAKIDSKEYEVKYIDNPMELDEQLEIYLKLLGGQ